MKLTAAFVASSRPKPGQKQTVYSDDGQRGMSLVVSDSARSWVYRFTLHGRRRRLTLGSYPALSLADARAAAASVAVLVARGIDPETNAETVSAAWARYWPSRLRELANPDQDLSKWRRLIEPVIGGVPLSALAPAHFDQLQAFWESKGQGAGQAGLLRIVKTFQSWLLDRYLLDRPFVPRKVTVPAGRVLAVPPLGAVRDFVEWARAEPWPRGPVCVLLALTGVRSQMIRGLEWSEVRGDHLRWPAGRCKGGRPFAQPLSGAAAALLADLPRSPLPWAFPSKPRTGPTSVDLSLHLKRSPLAGYRVHDLRHALASHGTSEFGWPPYVTGALLDHAPLLLFPGATSIYAGHGDLFWTERRAALEQWSGVLVG